MKTNMRSAVYTLDEFRQHVGDLTTQDGVSVNKACKAAKLANNVPFYNATRVTGDTTRGISTLKKILEAIGFRVQILVHVQKIKMPSAGRLHSIDPEMTRAIDVREALSNKTMIRRFGAHHKKARQLLLRK